MQTFTYKAKDSKTGKNIKAKVQADNEQSASKLISSQGLTPIEIKVDKQRSFGLNRIKAKDKVLFSRQLSTLINAGLPLVQALRSVAGQTTNKALASVINQVIVSVEAGTALSKALAEHPKVFNRVYISLVEASETSGTLDKGLERLADQQEKDADIVSKVRGALIYPLIVLLVMVAVVVFMLVKVLPQVQSIYSTLPGVSLPFVTRLLLGTSHVLIKYWFILVIILGILAFVGSRWIRTMGGRRVVDKVKMRAWPLGKLYMKLYMARFSRTGTTLVAAGVPVLKVLEITAEAVDNVYIGDSIHRAIEEVKGGKALSDALDNDPNFLVLVPNMLRIGEQSGAMETMLAKIADYYEKEVDNEIKAISTIIEPVMMILMGVVALTIVAAILLPIYGLVNQSGFSGG
ncbi:MAG: type II secretion system F family protein [Candidatus Saccharimonadales bacterium]